MARSVFVGGIHPPDAKEATADCPVVRLGAPERIVLPLAQHLGAPCRPLVAAGDRVARGQIVGDVEAPVSAPVHSPVNGTVSAVVKTLTPSGQRVDALDIAPDDDQDFDGFVPIPLGDHRQMIRSAGIVGLGGAAFPTTIKLTPPSDLHVKTVILNGCECEPYLTCDYRTMLEHPGAVVHGGRLIRDIVGAEKLVIAVESNKRDAAAILAHEASSDGSEVLVLETVYPQGAEKQLIRSVLGVEVPHGKLPAATGALVHNVSTACAIADAIERHKPLIERVVTVSGLVERPGNYLVPLGTLISELLEFAGGCDSRAVRVIAGGPMTGHALGDLDVPVVKGTSGVIVLPASIAAPAVMGDQPCIRCGRCSDACPMMLQPYAIGIYANKRDWDAADRVHALDCIECGCCSYVCPTRRPLVQLIRAAKHALMERGSKA